MLLSRQILLLGNAAAVSFHRVSKAEPEGLPEGSEGLPEGSEELPEAYEGQIEGSEG